MKFRRTFSFKSAAIATLVLLLSMHAVTPLLAGEEPKARLEEKPANGPTIYDQIWGLPVLYKEKSNPYIQEISLFGRIHGNWADVESSQGDWTDWEARRIRAGLKVKFLQQFEARGEVRFLPFADPIYDGFTEAVLLWSPDKAFKIGVGKQLARFLIEGAISSNELLTLERSNVANMFWIGEDNVSSGITIAGEIGNWQYYGGVFAGDMNKTFGKFRGGYYGVASLSYDFAKALHVDKAVLRADYVYNNGDPRNAGPKPFENIMTLGWDVKQGRYGFQGNVIYGSELDNQPAVFGLVVMPSFAISKKLELVGRYTFMSSADEDGIRPARRYESEVPNIAGTRGDRYQAVYGGLNYYIYGHKLKLQTGIEYTRMDDSAGNRGAYNSWSFISGIRLSF
jgi:phosphate-selective porin OprO/OprP